ncbi:hypothetical protein [uncultured Prevotella sp.]|uniref:hypothetical protein n=1 Tax=uncultured Prevotella sp. TaxID=159272 RepID=UPI0025999988|nr:hypothetical protein [uncultured Prevotella sp.]
MKSFLLGMFLVLFSLGTLACAENNKTGEEKFCTYVQNVSADVNAIVSKLKRDGATILCVCDKDDRQSIYYSKLIESEDSWAYTELFRYDLRTNNVVNILAKYYKEDDMQLKSDDGRIVNDMVYSSDVLAKGDNIIVVYSNMTAGVNGHQDYVFYYDTRLCKLMYVCQANEILFEDLNAME